MLAEDEEMSEIINDPKPSKVHYCDSDSLDNEPKNIESSSSCSSLESNGNKLVSSSTELVNDEETNMDEEDIVTNISGRLKKGRKQRHSQLRHVRKYNKYHNFEYTTVKNKIVKPKVFIDYKCKCSNKCANLISSEKRKDEFEKYVQLGSYNAQLVYIGSCVKEENKKRSYTMINVPAEKKKPKQFTRTYSIKGVRVCRDMFLKTFQITTQKITISLKKLRSGMPIMDYRGANRGVKISDDDYNLIVNTLKKLPKYESHYGRDQIHGTLFLQPGMTLAKIYDLYKYEHTLKYGEERKCASFSSLKKIFCSKFNFKCKKLKKDTCNKCDMYEIKTRNAKTEEEKEKATEEHTQHLERAKNLRNQMNIDFERARNSPTVECLTFDLEKKLPLPRIPTNVAFYKRQLWFYNSGIHSASDDTGHCYVWIEGEAGRGAQEVGSCLVKYIETKLSATVENLILWSDCCGGQNRNIKIVLMLKAILNNHDTLKTISFRYLESGHTFLPNDANFSKIETALRQCQRVYTDQEYIHIIKTCKKNKPLKVYKMTKNDFKSTEKLERNTINRNKFTDKSKINWLKTQEIKIEKDKKYSLFMRQSLKEDFKELNIDKNIKGNVLEINKNDLCLLWPEGKPISPAKLNDLQSLFPYIPEDCIEFYKALRSSEGIIEDVDGYCGSLDFEIEEDVMM